MDLPGKVGGKKRRDWHGLFRLRDRLFQIRPSGKTPTILPIAGLTHSVEPFVILLTIVFQE